MQLVTVRIDKPDAVNFILGGVCVSNTQLFNHTLENNFLFV
jgi:hypothetical protein